MFFEVGHGFFLTSLRILIPREGNPGIPNVLPHDLLCLQGQLLRSCISVMEVLYKRLMPHKLESSGQRHVMLDVYKGQGWMELMDSVVT